MNISAVQGAGPNGTASFSSSVDENMGKEEFLLLLVTQLSNQDPFDPLDPTEFTGQLTDYSSLEQLINLNDKLEAQTNSDTFNTMSMNTSLAASLVGQEVLAQGSQAFVSDSGEGSVIVDIGESGGSATINIYDSFGNQIATRQLGGMAGGRTEISLDQLDLPTGSYNYRLDVTTSDGEAVGVTHYSGGTVDGVQFDNGGIMLKVGDMVIPLTQLIEIGN